MIDKKPVALLVNPPIYDFALYDLYHKPYGLSRIGRWLELAGYQVDTVDAMDYRDELSTTRLGAPKRKIDGTGHFHRQLSPLPETVKGVDRSFARYGMVEESFLAKIRVSNPDVVFVGTGMTYWYVGVREAAEIVRKIHPGAPLVIGGVYATCMPEHAQKVIHPDLIVKGNDLSELKDFLGRRGLPVPEGAPGYESILTMGNPADAWVVKLNEGCPFSCDYCASPVLSPAFSRGKVDDAANEVMRTVNIVGTSHIAFYDDALLAHAHEVLIPFLERFMESDSGISFHLPNALHGSMITANIAFTMRRAGFSEIRIGFESPDPEFHANHGGKPGSGDFREVVEMLIDAGFAKDNIVPYVLAGLPGQDPDEVEHAIRYCLGLGVKPSVAEYSPIPGSILWEESVNMSSFPIEEEPLYQNNSLFAMQSSRFSLEDLWRLKRLSHQDLLA